MGYLKLLSWACEYPSCRYLVDLVHVIFNLVVICICCCYYVLFQFVVAFCYSSPCVCWFLARFWFSCYLIVVTEIASVISVLGLSLYFNFKTYHSSLLVHCIRPISSFQLNLFYKSYDLFGKKRNQKDKKKIVLQKGKPRESNLGCHKQHRQTNYQTPTICATYSFGNMSIY